MRVAYFLFLGVLALMTPVAHSGSDCRCPSEVRAPLNSCGPKPILPSVPIYSSEKNCSSSFINVQDTISLLGAARIDKSQGELLNYLHCYADSKQSFCHFKSTLAPYLGRACEASGLSFSVQACLVKQESGFRSGKNASSAGAEGYVQFNAPAIAEVFKIVGPKQSIEKFNHEKEVAQKRVNQLKSKVNLTVSEEVELRNVEAEILVNGAKAKALEVWNQYWKGVKPPQNLTLASAACPSIAFAMSVVKQAYEAQLLHLDLGIQPEIQTGVSKMNHIDRSIFLTGAYNMGLRKFRKYCGDSETLDACIQSLNRSKIEETSKHLSSIRNCAYRDSFEPMNNDPKKDCRGDACIFL